MEKLKRALKYLAVFFIILLAVYFNSCAITQTTYCIAMLATVVLSMLDMYFPSVCKCYYE